MGVVSSTWRRSQQRQGTTFHAFHDDPEDAADSDLDAADLDANGWNALHVHAFRGDADAAGCLLQRTTGDTYPLVVAADAHGRTPLHFARARLSTRPRGNDTVARMLIAHGARDDHPPDTWGRTPRDVHEVYHGTRKLP